MGSKDTTIIIWNTTNWQVIFKLKGHNNTVSTLVLLNNEIFASASWDRTIIFWNILTGNKIKTLLNAHDDQIWSLEKLENGLFASGSKDHTIKIWSYSFSNISAKSTTTNASISYFNFKFFKIFLSILLVRINFFLNK